MPNEENKDSLLNALMAWGNTPPATKSIAPPPPPPPSPANSDTTKFATILASQLGLGELFKRPIAQGLYYNNKVIVLDGFEFEGCRFDNCTLKVNSTNFALRNCVLDPSTAIQYGNESIKVVHLFNSRTEWYYTNNSTFAPIKNSDGTISITGATV